MLSTGNLAALAGVMIVLAAVPSVSVLTVSARAAAFGFWHGVWTTLGIVAADAVFIVIAIFGLSVLAGHSAGLLVWVRYLGGVYLVWLGIALWRSARPSQGAIDPAASRRSSFTTGLLITFGDQKAIAFYLGFFPAFLDLSHLTLADAWVVVALATSVVGSVKLAYAYAAARAGGLLCGSQAATVLNRLAAVTLCGVGGYLRAF